MTNAEITETAGRNGTADMTTAAQVRQVCRWSPRSLQAATAIQRRGFCIIAETRTTGDWDFEGLGISYPELRRSRIGRTA